MKRNGRLLHDICLPSYGHIESKLLNDRLLTDLTGQKFEKLCKNMKRFETK